MKFVSITTAMLAILFMIGLMGSYSSADDSYVAKTEKSLISDNGNDSNNNYEMVKSQTRDRKKDGSCDGTQQQNGSKNNNNSGTKSKNGNGSGDKTRSRDGSNCDGTGPKSSNPGGNSGK